MTGSLEVYAGCMFSSKSSTLIRKLNRAKYEKKTVVAVKPSIDGRYSTTGVATHDGVVFEAVPVSYAMDILNLPGITGAGIVGIDEAQFFDPTIVDVCRVLVGLGKQVVVAGLDLDSTAKAFGSMGTLLAMADKVTKLHAACTVCGGDATRTQRIVSQDDTVLVGGSESYEARCHTHWSPEPGIGHA